MGQSSSHLALEATFGGRVVDASCQRIPHAFPMFNRRDIGNGRPNLLKVVHKNMVHPQVWMALARLL